MSPRKTIHSPRPGRESSPGRRRGARDLGTVLVTSLAVAMATPACASSDPTLANAIAALGTEDAAIPKGENHRAGQPCTVCHNTVGTAKGDFSIAGTIFASQTRAYGVEGVSVSLVDSTSTARTATTNCVGNFYIGRTESYGGVAAWDPQFPVKVTIWKPGIAAPVPMNALINRAGSCSTCHSVPQSTCSAGLVWLGPTFDENVDKSSNPVCAPFIQKNLVELQLPDAQTAAAQSNLCGFL